jgi:hypothetical protein
MQILSLVIIFVLIVLLMLISRRLQRAERKYLDIEKKYRDLVGAKTEGGIPEADSKR